MKVAHQENSASGKEELHEEIGEVLYVWFSFLNLTI